MIHTKELAKKKKTCISVSALFSHSVLPTWEFTCTHIPEHTLTLTLPLGGRCVQLCACVRISWHTGQSDVPSHICQHPLFIYLGILSYVDPVTWSEGGRCRATDTPGSPVRTWWETRVCDLVRAHTCTHYQAFARGLAQYDLLLSLSNSHFPTSFQSLYGTHWNTLINVKFQS